jgi:hypothetical protein
LNQYTGFREAYKKASENPQNTKENIVFLNEGMALIQANCSAYFTRLGSGAQHLGFARKETSLTGGLAAALMGLAEASATAISATASAFGFTTASMDNFADAYLFSPDIRAAQDLVMSALESNVKIGNEIIADAKSKEWEAKGLSLTYTQVSKFLIEMESHCQPHGIRSLITRAVDTQKAVPSYEVGSLEQLEQTIKTFEAAAQRMRESKNKQLNESAAAPAPQNGASAPIAAASKPTRTQLEFSPSTMRSQSLILQNR